MIESIQALLRLQEVDLRLAAAREESERFPSERQLAAAERAREAAEVAAANEVLTREEQRQRHLELELRDVEALLEKLGSQLYEVTSKLALEALESETARAREHKSSHEDAILELLEEIDTARDALRDARAREEQGREAGEANEASRIARERELEEEVAGLEQTRCERAEAVDAAAVDAYDHARRRQLPALVFVEAKSCPLCRMVIAPQRLLDLRSAKSLVTCGSCGRIFYGEKVQQAEQSR